MISTSAAAQANPAAEGTALQEIVVTARRTSENLQQVPVAVTVITPKVVEASGAFTPLDLATVTPGLSAAASISDRNNIIFSIRGQNVAYGSLFPAVITYFNEVPVTQIGPGMFFDLADIQVLRGPQGVLFGRVTDGGNVLITPQHPTNSYEGYIGGKLGNYNLRNVSGAVNLPIVPDKLAIRAAFDINRRDGFTTNIFNGQKLDDIRYESFRIGASWRPTDSIDNYTVVSYQHTHDHGSSVVPTGVNGAAILANTAGLFGLFPGVYGINANGDVVPFQPGLTPLTGANFLASLQSQIAKQQALGKRKVNLTTPNFQQRDNLYVVNTTTVDLPYDLQFKNILGYTNLKARQAFNYGGANGGAVLTCDTACPDNHNLPFNWQEQFSEEMRLAGHAFNKSLSWSVGLYGDFQRPGGAFENDTINVAILQRDGVQYTQTYSDAAFAFGEYDASSLLPGLKFNAGIRYTQDRVKSQEATYVAPIPAPNLVPALTGVLQFLGLTPAQAAGVAAATTAPTPGGVCQTYGVGSVLGASGVQCLVYKATFNATTWTVGSSYQFSPRQMVYAKLSRGYRPGGVNGAAPPDVTAAYNPEFDVSAEFGLKSDWSFGDVQARTNIALYHDNYKKIQANVTLQGAVPVSVIRNVDDAVVQGVEFEGTLIPVHGLTLGLTFNYTDAQFKKFAPETIAACDPTAATVVGFCPYNMFAFTPKTQVGVTFDYVLPTPDRVGIIAVGGKYYHQSREALNYSSRLNPLAVEAPYGTLDLNASWRNAFGHPVELTAFVTNVTNKLYRVGTNDLSQRSSLGVISDIYSPPRMWGVGLRYRFGAGS